MDVKKDAQEPGEPVPPGTTGFTMGTKPLMKKPPGLTTPLASPSSPSMLKAKKKLRAFSIQKKAAIPTVTVPKPVSTGSTTVLIGKLSGVKATPKPDPPDPDVKKPPKPPRPGTSKRHAQETYTELQKKNVAEIEDMKRKMELVDLGIPLGLICPTTNEKAMPTKAMPPIKSFLDPAKVDELICEAKKARAEGKKFKFDLHKFLPDYDNPFQRKKDPPPDSNDNKPDQNINQSKGDIERRDKDRRKSDKFDNRKYSEFRKDDRDRFKGDRDRFKHDRDRFKDDRDRYKNDRDKHKDKSRERDKKEKGDTKTEKEKDNSTEKNVKETDVNLNDYLVCDSWSLDNEEKTNSSSPKIIDKSAKPATPTVVEIDEKLKEAMEKRDMYFPPKKTKEVTQTESPVSKPIKIEKLQPVMDSFKYELDSNEDEILDIFDEESDLEKYSQPTAKSDKYYDSPVSTKMFDYNQEPTTADDENFLESVINEIKQEDMSDISQDKGLVEYDMSPTKDDNSNTMSRESVTPELDERMRDMTSQQSHYSDGYRSSESGYKSRESGYKSDRSESYRMSVEKELDEALEQKLSKCTMESLETWSFVLKICQPLLFRHDKNKCYKETHTEPKLWYTENPRLCNCVKDRAIVYDELETCKMAIVDRVYGCDQIPEASFPIAQPWYPRLSACLTDGSTVHIQSSDWEMEDSQIDQPRAKQSKEKRRSMTPQRSEEIYLDREYQRFMEAVWPEVNEIKPETSNTSRSTTPVKQETRKKKKPDDQSTDQRETEDKKKAKKMKLSSEGWSQESDIEEEADKSKKIKLEKEKRKRKHSTSSLSSPSDDEIDSKKRKKMVKKKVSKKARSKSAKRRRLSKKVKKLKEKQNKKKFSKSERSSEDTDDDEDLHETRKEKKAKRKKQLKLKRAQKKKKAKAKSSSSSSSSSSESSSESESDDRRKKKKRDAGKKKKKDKRRKKSSDSTQSEDLFDVNILNNIKTERLTDDEKNQSLNDFSPRRQKPRDREIINVKELQNDFVGNNIHIKQEMVDTNDGSEYSNDKVQAKVKVQETVDYVQDKVDSSQEKLQTIQEKAENIQEKANSVQKTSEILEEKAESAPKKNDSVQKKNQVVEEKIQVVQEKNQVAQEKIQVPQEKNQSVGEKNHQAVQEKHMSIQEKRECVEKQKIIETRVEDIELPTTEPVIEFKEPQERIPQTPDQSTHIQIEESNNSQCSSQESTCSVKEQAAYEKDDSHLRPSSQNSNYSFHDVITASQGYKMDEEDKFGVYEHGNYEMYEQLALAYQNDVASMVRPVPPPSTELTETLGGIPEVDVGIPLISRIETVVGGRRRGEIKCDWRAGDRPATTHQQRPSRWGLKPGEVNIVLTGGGDQSQQYTPQEESAVYRIESIANRTSDNTSMSYDEAYMDMYGASDRLQYGDCFATPPPQPPPQEEERRTPSTSSLDARIDKVLRDSVLSEVAKEATEEQDKDTPDKGILVNKAVPVTEGGRGVKRVSFADGYKPGQDSDVEEPPVKKKKKSRRVGCAWPCPASHPDHVPLWDALPPPPPPPGSPPPPAPARPPPPALLRQRPPPRPHLLPDLMPYLAHAQHKFDPNTTLPPFMPPEPPPGLVNFH